MKTYRETSDGRMRVVLTCDICRRKGCAIGPVFGIITREGTPVGHICRACLRRAQRMQYTDRPSVEERVSTLENAVAEMQGQLRSLYVPRTKVLDRTTPWTPPYTVTCDGTGYTGWDEERFKECYNTTKMPDTPNTPTVSAEERERPWDYRGLERKEDKDDE